MVNQSTPNQQPGTPYSNGGDRPSDNQPSQSAASILLTRLTSEIDGLKQTINAQHQQSSTEISRLRKQLRWLTGVSAVAIVVLGGALVGVSLNLRQEQIALRESQQELVAQIEGLQSGQITSEQLAQLEELLSSLNQTTGNLQEQARSIIEQIPGASREQLESLQGDLEDLQNSVQDQLSQEEGSLLDQVNGLFQRIQNFLGSGNEEEETTEGSGT
jgi:hypothetical protein